MKVKYLPMFAVAAFAVSAYAGDYGKWFTEVDANADGYLSAAELGAEKAYKIEKMDMDGDGLISRDELEAYKAHKKHKKNDRT